MPPVRQPSFSAGELAPELHGRVDLPQYGHALRRCRNFFISRHGAAVSRPGTKYVCSVKYRNDPSRKVRLVAFRYADDESYVLEVGHLYIRFIFRGEQVTVTDAAAWSAVTEYEEGAYVTHNGATYRSKAAANLNQQPDLEPVWWEQTDILEVTTPYVEDDIAKLDFAQSGDILWITHPSYTPRTLSRFGALDWRLTELDFSVPAYFGADTYRATSPIPTADTTHPAVEWSYRVTAVGRTLTGMLVESLPVDITQDSTGAALPASLSIYPDAPLQLALSGTEGTLPDGIQSFVGYRFYRGRAGTYGFIGETKSGQVTTWKDFGQVPDEAIPPPAGRNPFEIHEADGSTLLRTEKPAAVCFYEDRLVFGGTTERPGHLFASASGSYLNFDERRPSTADEALELELASRTREAIRRLLPRGKLLVFTDASVWALGGADGPLSATGLMDARVQVEVGSAWLAPLLVRDAVLYARTKGHGVMHLAPSDEGYSAAELSLLSSHFFQGVSIVDWTYAEDPWGVVWVVLSDGRFASLTYLPGGMAAWALHETATQVPLAASNTSVVESICAVPESTEDGVYLAVKRKEAINLGEEYDIRVIERMTDRVVDEDTALEDIICLDAAHTYEGPATDTISGLTWLANNVVVAVADGVVRTGLSVNNAGVCTLPVAASKVHIGLPFTPELESLNFADGRAHKKAVRKVLLEVFASKGLRAGQDFDHLFAWTEGDASEELITGLVEVPVSTAWSAEGSRVALRQTLPFPVTVISLIRELEVGGGA